jgi:hypothetical protein
LLICVINNIPSINICKMKKTHIVFTILILTINLSFSQTKEEKKKNKEETAKKEYEKTKSLIEAGTYIFEPDGTITQKGKRIDLTTNYGYLKIDKEKAEADLPYFGVVQVASYTGDGGIKFNNENVIYEISFDDKKQNIIIKFNATQKTESFNIILSVFKSGSSSLTISSNKRNGASYDGKVTALTIQNN